MSWLSGLIFLDRVNKGEVDSISNTFIRPYTHTETHTHTHTHLFFLAINIYMLNIQIHIHIHSKYSQITGLTVNPVTSSVSVTTSFLTITGLKEALVTLIMHPSPIFRLLYCIAK